MAADTFKKLSRAVVSPALLLPLAMLVVALLVAIPARGAEVTRVVSAMDGTSHFDFNLTATYFYDTKSAFVKRELESGRSAETEIIKDLKFGQTRHILNLRADVGVLWDVGLHVELPLVLVDSSKLDFDRSESNCTFPEDGVGMPNFVPSCVDSHNSTILRDGILPGYNQDSWGLDAQHLDAQNRPRQYSRTMYPGPANAFQGPNRKGFQYLGVGITWAAFNQARDDTKPTWTLSFDALLDVFADKRFDPGNPGANTAVGEGYHQFVWSTFVSKRFRWFEPYWGAWYNLPVRTNGSSFIDYGPTQTSVDPQQSAGTMIGVEQIAWENPRGDQRVTFEARAYLTEHFFGRGRSEIWEALAGDSRCSAGNQANCRAGIDLDTNGDGILDAPHPGITDIEAYGTIGGQAGFNVQVGKFIRFRALGGFQSDMPHMITAASAGVDANNNGIIDPPNPMDPNMKREDNPTYRQAIDLPGRRFRVEGTQIWSVFVQGSMMF